MAGYRDIEIYNTAFEIALHVHPQKAKLKLPQFELYEQGSQIRRSSIRIKYTIA